MIEISNLYKSFEKKSVLKDISLTLDKGTIFGLIGINGAGKSTFLRLIMGVLLPDMGEIKIEHQSLQYNSTLRKSIFYLSDQPPFHNQMTFRNLADLYKVFYPFEEQTFKTILDLFSLDENVNLSQISKGMKRQGYIALAFASGAKYLLLDEVFDGLDPAARLKFKKLMISTDHQDKVIIITSHSLRELEDICDSFGMIDEGHFKRYGNLDFELNKLTKYQIILKDTPSIQLLNQAGEPVYFNQDGRVLTVVIDSTHTLDQYIDKDMYHVADELPISFEEYFMINQKGDKS